MSFEIAATRTPRARSSLRCQFSVACFRCVRAHSILGPKPVATMGLIRLLAAPIRTIVRFPLFQLAFVVAIILLLQAADDKSTFGQIFNGLDKLVDATVRLFSELFDVKSFTRSGLTAGLMIAYVYLACLLILFLMRVTI